MITPTPPAPMISALEEVELMVVVCLSLCLCLCLCCSSSNDTVVWSSRRSSIFQPIFFDESSHRTSAPHNSQFAPQSPAAHGGPRTLHVALPQPHAQCPIHQPRPRDLSYHVTFILSTLAVSRNPQSAFSLSSRAGLGSAHMCAPLFSGKDWYVRKPTREADTARAASTSAQAPPKRRLSGAFTLRVSSLDTTLSAAKLLCRNQSLCDEQLPMSFELISSQLSFSSVHSVNAYLLEQ